MAKCGHEVKAQHRIDRKIMQKFLIIVVAIFICACGSVEKRQSKQASIGVYAIQSALNEGRVDLAKKYADETVKVLPPPKKKNVITVKAIIAPPLTEDPTEPVRKLTILPDSYQPFIDNGLIFTTAELKRVATVEPEIAKQIEAEEKEFETFKEDVAVTQQKVFEKAVEKPKKSLPWLFIISSAVLVAACFINPALIPLIVGKILGLFKALLDSIAKLLK